MELKGRSHKVLTYDGDEFVCKPFIAAYNDLKKGGDILTLELREDIYAMYNCDGDMPIAAFVKKGRNGHEFLGVEDLAYGNVVFTNWGHDISADTIAFIKSLGKLWVEKEPMLALSIKDFSKEMVLQ